MWVTIPLPEGDHGIQNGFLGIVWISIPKCYGWKSIPFQIDNWYAFMIGATLSFSEKSVETRKLPHPKIIN
jgi:hypothetical protein